MTIWSKYFQKATWTGGTWGSGEFDPGDLSPEEICLALAYTYLSQDSLLLKVFTSDRIEMMDIRNPTEFRDLPRLQCYLGSLSEDRVASKLDDTELFIFFGIRYNVFEGFKKIVPGEVGSPAVMRKVKRVLKDFQDLRVQISGKSDERPMVSNSNQEGGLSYIIDADETNQMFAVTLELQWRYRIKINSDTGQIYNIEAP